MKWSRIVLIVLAVVAGAVPAAAREYCCALTEVDKESGRVKAGEGAKGRTFDFVVTDSRARKTLQVGQPVDADFKKRDAWLPPAKKRYRILNIVAGSGRKGFEAKLQAVTTKRVDKLGNEVGVVGGREGQAAVVLSGPATPQGDHGPIVTLTSGNESLLRVPQAVEVAPRETSEKFTFITSPVAAPTEVTISASYNGVIKTGTVTVVPAKLLRITVAPVELLGGTSATGTAVFNGPPAAAGQLKVKLTSNNPAVSLPSSVSLEPGTTQLTFQVTTHGVDKETPVVITGSQADVQKEAELTLQPGVLEHFGHYNSQQPEYNQWDDAWRCTSPCNLSGWSYWRWVHVGLSAVAPPQGAVIALRSTDPNVVQVPATLTVPAGEWIEAFQFTVAPVTSEKRVELKASYRGVTKEVTIRVKPLIKPDLYILREVEFFDRHENPITSPPDSQPFRMCATVVSYGEEDPELGDYPSILTEPSMLRVSYINSRGTGRTFDVRTEFPSDINIGQARSTTPCAELPGLADGDHYEITLEADATKVVDERKEGNNKRNARIER